MNEKTTLPIEAWNRLSSESPSLAMEETDPTMVSETLIPYEIDSSVGLIPFFSQDQDAGQSISDIFPQETEETTTITVVDYTPVIYDVSNGIIASVLFGAFLIAGLLASFKIMEVNPHGH